MSETLVEALARAMYEERFAQGILFSWRGWPATWQEVAGDRPTAISDTIIGMARAVLSELDRLGYAVVPKEPTEEMLKAAWRATYNHAGLNGRSRQVNEQKMRMRWTAMLSAALKAE